MPQRLSYVRRRTNVSFPSSFFPRYFYADYYSRQDDTTLIKLGKYLLQSKSDPFDDDSSFRMLYDLEPEKVERFIIFPYLQEIFSAESETEQFWKYICAGYRDWQFFLVDENNLEKYHVADEDAGFRMRRESNCTVKSVIQSKILSLLSKEYDCPAAPFDLSVDEKFLRPNLALYGEKFTFPDSEEEHIRFYPIPCRDEGEFEEWVRERKEHDSPIITDENDEPVIFGYYCRFNFKHIIESPDECQAIIALWSREDCPAKEEFHEVQALYNLYKTRFDTSDDIDDDDF